MSKERFEAAMDAIAPEVSKHQVTRTLTDRIGRPLGWARVAPDASPEVIDVLTKMMEHIDMRVRLGLPISKDETAKGTPEQQAAWEKTWNTYLKHKRMVERTDALFMAISQRWMKVPPESQRQLYLRLGKMTMAVARTYLRRNEAMQDWIAEQEREARKALKKAA